MKTARAAFLLLSLLAARSLFAGPPSNFGVVLENGIYRGAHPDESELDYLKHIGIKTILKLNTHGLAKEQAAADRLGLSLINVPLDPSTVGGRASCSDVAKALAVVQDRSRWPIYVHCTSGRDRTGFLIGAYRELVQGWSWLRVDKELSQFGHNDSKRQVFPLIARELSARVPTCTDALTRVLGNSISNATLSSGSDLRRERIPVGTDASIGTNTVTR